MKNFVLTLDLKNEPEMIDSYIKHHQSVWPEVIESIKDSGIRHMKIFHVADRLVMTIEAEESFSFEQKARRDLSSPKVVEWEKLMDQYQRRLPFAASSEKWVLMNMIFEL